MTLPPPSDPAIDPIATLHADQIAYWNGAGGAHWVAEQARTDRVMAPVARLVIERAMPLSGLRVLDVGCGCGATTLAAAAAVGPSGRVTGLDVSAPMLGLAEARARDQGPDGAPITWHLADAANAPLPPGEMDRVISRFGVMFFGDPTRAFTRLRTTLAPGGRLVFACWRAPAENPWMMLPLQAAYAHVPRLPRPGPEEPGPFSFADPARVRRILTDAGFAEPVLEPVDLSLDLGGGDGLESALAQTLAIGATSRALDGQPAAVVSAAAQSIRAALTPYAGPDGVRLGAAIWLVTAQT